MVVNHLGGHVVNGFPYTGSNEKLNHHVGTRLWDAVAQLVDRHTEPEIVALLTAPNPFVDWEVGDRYAEGSHLTEAKVDGHLAGAKKAIAALESASISMNGGLA